MRPLPLLLLCCLALATAACGPDDKETADRLGEQMPADEFHGTTPLERFERFERINRRIDDSLPDPNHEVRAPTPSFSRAKTAITVTVDRQEDDTWGLHAKVGEVDVVFSGPGKENALAKWASAQSESRVTLRADRDAPWSLVVTVLNALMGAGVTDVVSEVR